MLYIFYIHFFNELYVLFLSKNDDFYNMHFNAPFTGVRI